MKFTGWSRARLQRRIRAIQRRNRALQRRFDALRAKLDAYNRSTAIHEAAHAVLAIRLKLWLDYARLRTDFLGLMDGHVKLKYPPVGNRAAERDIVMTCAGVEAAKLFAQKLTPGFLRVITAGAVDDERYIKRLSKAHHIHDIEKLRRKAAFLVRVHRREIFAVSCVLLRAAGKKVPARTIRMIYHSKRRATYAAGASQP